MQFSIFKIMSVMAFVSVVLGATFALPLYIGFPLLSFLSSIVLPPFLIVGVINTRGLRQSFFLGAMISGTPHFIVSVYFAVMYGLSVGANESIYEFYERGWLYVHGIGYILGAMGGVSGMAAYWFLQTGKKPAGKVVSISDRSESSKPSDNAGSIFSDSEFSDSEFDAPEDRSAKTSPR